MKEMTRRRRDPAEVAALMAAKPKKAVPIPKELRDLAKGPIDLLVGLVFWQARHRVPEMGTLITAKDLHGYKACLKYNGQVPKIVIEAKPTGVFVRMADAATGDMITPIEDNPDDFDAAQAATRLRRMRENLPNLVNAVRGDMSQGVTSNDTINQLCDAALMLARQA